MPKPWQTTSLLLGALLPACTLVTGSLDGYAGPGTVAADASDDRPVSADDAAVVADAADATSASASYRDAILRDLPTAYFRLGEAETSAVVRDEVTGQTGDIAEPVTRGEPGGIAADLDTSMTFDGSGSVRFPGSTMDFSGLAAFSIECWIKPSLVDQNYRRIVTNEGADGAGRQGWLLWVVERTNGGVGFERYVNGKADGVISRSRPPADRWTYVVGTYDGVRLSLYIDGVLLEAAPSPGALVGQSLLRLGSGVASGIVGGLDEVAIYSRALSADRVAAHHALGRATR